MTDEAFRELSDPVLIGVITTPHGVRGTLRVKPTGSGQHLRKDLRPFVGRERRRILKSRPTPKGFLIDLEGVGSRKEADSLRGTELFLDRGELDPPEEGEFYVSDLVGMTAFDVSGERVGSVAETFETAAHEILVIRAEGGDDGGELYVPFTMEHVLELDIEAGRIIVAPPEE